MKLIVIPVNEFINLIDNAFDRYENRKLEKEQEKVRMETLFTINQVARRLGRAHATIKKLVAEGILKTTPDGLISEKSINEYLKNV